MVVFIQRVGSTADNSLAAAERAVAFGDGFTLSDHPAETLTGSDGAQVTGFAKVELIAKPVSTPSAPASGVRFFVDVTDGRPKAIDAHGVVMPLDFSWLTFNNWALVSSTYTAHPCELVLTDTSTGSPTITLPDATTCPGKRVRVFDTKNNAASHQINIATTGGQTIDGSVATPLLNNLRGTTYLSNGTNWNRETAF